MGSGRRLCSEGAVSPPACCSASSPHPALGPGAPWLGLCLFSQRSYWIYFHLWIASNVASDIQLTHKEEAGIFRLSACYRCRSVLCRASGLLLIRWSLSEQVDKPFHSSHFKLTSNPLPDINEAMPVFRLWWGIHFRSLGSKRQSELFSICGPLLYFSYALTTHCLSLL